MTTLQHLARENYDPRESLATCAFSEIARRFRGPLAMGFEPRESQEVLYEELNALATERRANMTSEEKQAYANYKESWRTADYAAVIDQFPAMIAIAKLVDSRIEASIHA